MSIRLNASLVASAMVLVFALSVTSFAEPATQARGVVGKVVDDGSRQLVEWHNNNLIKVTVQFHLTLADDQTQDGTVDLEAGQVL